MTEPVAVFMVELVNEHEQTGMRKVYCGMGPACAEEHALDERGARWHPPEREFTDTVWDVARIDTGEIVATDVWHLSSCRVAGAMYWLPMSEAAADERKSGSHIFASGPQLEVILPDLTPWNIDSRAHNCTMPADFDHRCWVRHGEPPAITVDKNGLTCAAGAGSIQSGGYHGFLRDGRLVVA
jgi:hypothetical protein